jgi:hypothetical protein
MTTTAGNTQSAQKIVPFTVQVYEEEFCTPEAAIALAAIKSECRTTDTGGAACIRIPVRLINGTPVPMAQFDVISCTTEDITFERALHLVKGPQKDLFYHAAIEAMPGNQSTFLWSKYAQANRFTAPNDIELNMLYTDGALMIYHENPVEYYQEHHLKRNAPGGSKFMGAVCTIFLLPATTEHQRLQRLRQRDVCLSFFRRLVFLDHADVTLDPTLSDIQV